MTLGEVANRAGLDPDAALRALDDPAYPGGRAACRGQTPGGEGHSDVLHRRGRRGGLPAVRGASGRRAAGGSEPDNLNDGLKGACGRSSQVGRVFALPAAFIPWLRSSRSW
jgi:hypothetical protein